MLPCSRYRTPPCTSLVLRLLVPLPKSCASTSTTSKPRAAASTATPTPGAPPPITAMSHGALESLRSRILRIMASRFIFCFLSIGPVSGALHGAAPAGATLRALRCCHLWFEVGVILSLRAQFFGASPEIYRQTGQIRRAQRRGLRHARPQHRHAQHVGLEL